jgi:peptidoglycan/LPS O-acetylase OafA/YrhL
LLVLFGHISVATDVRFPFFLDAFGRYPNLGVYVFFMISGFVVPWSLLIQRYTIRQFPRYMLRRLVRLDPPYFAMVAIGVAVGAYRSQQAGMAFPFSWSTIALHLGYLAGLAGRPWIVTVFWTLGIEFQFYILMGLAFPLISLVPKWLADETVTIQATPGFSSRVPTRRGLLLLLLALGLLQLVIILIHKISIEGTTWNYYCEYFLVGFLAFVVKAGLFPWTVLVVFCLTGAAIGGYSLGWAVVSVMSLLIVAFPNRLAWVWTTRFGALMNGLGYISYSLYLTHPVVVGWLTRRAMNSAWISTDAWAVLVYLGEVVLTLFVATVF